MVIVQERRRQREKEAEARREAERKENMKNDPRTEEIAAISAQLAPINLRIRRVASDGHCLYHALASQLNGENDLPDVSLFYEEMSSTDDST